MSTVFVAGTDTGVGKTRCAALLLRALRDRGINAVPMKPVQTGATRGPDGRLTAPDLAQTLALAGWLPPATDRAWMCPYLYEPACSPHLAARLAGQEIKLDRILDAWRALAARYDVVLVEGAGGVLVPLNGTQTMLDLMAAMAAPVVLAARPGLGTLNHTLLTLREVRRAGLPVAGLVLVHTQPDAEAWIVRDNLATLARLEPGPLLLEVPYAGPQESPAADSMTPLVQRLAATARGGA